MTQSTLVRLAVRLNIAEPDLGPYVEEVLWTLDAVESVTAWSKPEFRGIEVIGLGEGFADAVRMLIADHELDESITLTDTRPIQEEDWAESWKQYWKVTRMLPNLVIQPSWEAYTPESTEEIVLTLDPGQAFGTGTHETTQLMLLLVRDILKQGRSFSRMLDVGCGSGILAIYGAKLGVPDVVATDIDPIATEVTRQNAQNNQAPVETPNTSLDQLAQTPFDLITANILTKTLVELMPLLKEALAPQGVLLLSGITVGQGQTILESLAENGLVLQRLVQKKDWLAIACTHRD